jgi:NitT/TauT family transport system substrate-binding protein
MDLLSEGKHRGFCRRSFLGAASALGACSFVSYPSCAFAEPPPETPKITLFENPVTCLVPQYVAKELLHSEGFTDVRYLKWPIETQKWAPEVLLSGEADISLSFVPSDIVQIEAGAPVVVLAGSHIGCVELVGGPRVKSALDLKGKKVAMQMPRSDEQIFVSMFAKYVGLNADEIDWVVHQGDHWQLLADGKIDAFMSGPPGSIELRNRKIGHVMVNTTEDAPWSHYFCCVIASTRDYVQKYPVATKRALRAVVKAADVCALEPNRVARLVADKGLASYDNALQMLREIPYGKWREHDPEDSMRFFALRMREVGYVKTTPQKIIAQGTDWRFLNELKRELKV